MNDDYTTAGTMVGGLTVGTVTTIDNTVWTRDIYPYTSALIYQCSDDVHVWACAHAETCCCGKVRRKVEPPKCGVCGK